MDAKKYIEKLQFEHFELGKKAQLIEKFPQHAELIERLCKEH